MQYPPEWVAWDMLTEELLDIQIGEYYPGSERASEHYRNGAFNYWLHKDPSKDVLIKLAKLSFLDPDTLMAEWLRNEYIAKAQYADEEVKQVLSKSL